MNKGDNRGQNEGERKEGAKTIWTEKNVQKDSTRGLKNWEIEW